jgi:hypothetical protein
MSRINESIDIMNQIYGLGFDREYAPVKELSKRLSDHIKTGEPWEGEIIFKEYGRIAELSIPKDTKLRIRLKLKKIHYTDE